ncbi:MAG: hypothetical protein Q4F97_06365 [Bacteroidales bacterium]|nr:hypothetical protein [Bacteroidales bacterium]
MKHTHFFFKAASMLIAGLCYGCSSQQSKQIPETAPNIVNIINFVRQTEPRPINITDQDLFNTTANQLKLLQQYNLKGTFLLQYDALINADYQALMHEAEKSGSEIGGWWEITQPHVEACQMTWRGAYPWDWHANVGFATGYTPEERIKLVDAYMQKFKEIFNYYPKSVGSWFIDAVTLQYMREKYNIEASCNCRDQVGTDGYTLWGGYWSQGYYPSRKNAYMPAQNIENQIDVPVFRMLGSDPINQYDCGIGGSVQGVETLEPVYGAGGGNKQWIDWYFRQFTDSPSLNFQYVQVGQENSFTWGPMQNGLSYQTFVVDSLVKQGKVKLMTLAETGKWFKEKFKFTPVSSSIALEDIKPAERKSLWFNSRFYRTNIIWENSSLRFRDIHLFDENLESFYLNTPGTSTQCNYKTLPIVDGFNWSSDTEVAGLRLKKVVDGVCSDVKVMAPQVVKQDDNSYLITTPLQDGGNCIVMLSEKNIQINMKNVKGDYIFLFSADKEKTLPFEKMDNKSISCNFNNFGYHIDCTKGEFVSSDQVNNLIVRPDKDGCIIVDLAQRTPKDI